MKNIPNTFAFSKITVYFIGVIIFTLFTLNFLLLYQNNTLSPVGKILMLKVGDELPPIKGLDNSSNEITFDWKNDSRKTVALIFSPNCGYCHKNIPNWKLITGNINPHKFRVVLISTNAEKTDSFIKQHDIQNFPIIFQPEPKTIISYLMHLTPQTVLLDQTGKIEKIWIGEIQPEQIEDIKTALELNK